MEATPRPAARRARAAAPAPETAPCGSRAARCRSTGACRSSALPTRSEPSIANVSRIQRLIDEGKIDTDHPVDPKALDAAGAIRDPKYVKILGDGDITSAVDVSAHAFSDSARRKIEEAGGSVTILDK